jgi:hypothetical protein
MFELEGDSDWGEVVGQITTPTDSLVETVTSNNTLCAATYDRPVSDGCMV